jgi:hypothetical protein
MNNTDQILQMRKSGVGYKKIARDLKLGVTYVSHVLIDNGITDHIRMPEESIVNKIIELYEYHTTSEIASIMHISESRITPILKISGIQPRKPSYHRNYENKVTHHYFDIIDDEHKAYWLGFLYADGYNNEKFFQVELTLKKDDIEILEKLKEDLNCSYEISYKESVNANRLTIYSKQISETLKSKGCFQAKSLKLIFPNEDQVPEHLIHHFMRGYFDGDGCISGDHFSVIGTVSFLDSFSSKLNLTKVKYISEGQAFRYAKHGRNNLKKIYDYLYKDATIFLERKKYRFDALFGGDLK